MIIYYSPKVQFDGNEILHACTAIGEVADEEIYQVRESPGFQTIPEKGALYKTGEVRIARLIQDLSFISNIKSWGYSFRFGLLEMQKDDFIVFQRGFIRVNKKIPKKGKNSS